MPDPSGALTEEEFAADIAAGRSRALAPPQISLTAEQWTQQVPAPAPPQPQIVDRVAYLEQLKQRWTQMESERIERERQRLLQNTLGVEGKAAGVPGLNTMRRAFGTTAALAAKPYEINIEAPSGIAPPGRPTGGLLPGDVAFDALNTGIPYSEPVRRVAGDVGARVAPQLLKQTNPLAPAFGAVADLIPGVDSEQAVAETGRVAAEALVPTKVWEAALMLLPAAKARTIPELLSAIVLGDVDALKAVRNAGSQLGQSATVNRGLAIMASERGAGRFGAGREFTIGDRVPDNVRFLRYYQRQTTPDLIKAWRSKLSGLGTSQGEAKAGYLADQELIRSVLNQRALQGDQLAQGALGGARAQLPAATEESGMAKIPGERAPVPSRAVAAPEQAVAEELPRRVSGEIIPPDELGIVPSGRPRLLRWAWNTGWKIGQHAAQQTLPLARG